MGSGCLGWHNVGAGPSGNMHPVTGWDTCADECAFGCMRVRAGIWGCLMPAHKLARWVSGILWVPVQSAAVETVPGQAPHSLLLSPRAQEDTPTPHPRVQGLGWEVRWAVAPGGTAVWLPGLGDRWPQHSRLCLPGKHSHLSSVSWGAGGWGLPVHPPLSPGQSAASQGAPSPFLVPAPSSQPLTPLGAPPRCRHPQTTLPSTPWP